MVTHRLRPRLAKRALEQRARVATGACLVFVMVVVGALIGMVMREGLVAFFSKTVRLDTLLLGTSWNPTEGSFGALPLLVGSFSVALLSALITLPLAVGSAVFVVELHPTIGQRIFQPLIELLAGIPSVVYGLVGLAVINTAIRMIFGEAAQTGAGILSGSVVLAIMILPTVTTLSIDALTAVPHELRESSLALGCTRWQTICHVVIRAARPSIATGLVLGIARAFGETLAVQMVIGGVERSMPSGLLDPAATLTTALTSGLANTPTGTNEYYALWSLGLLLLGMSLAFVALVHLMGARRSARD